MSFREPTTQKIYYSIGEVAALFGVKPSLIRFWESEFDIICPKKNKKGNHIYTQEDIGNLRIIYHLVKERGYTLEGARLKLRNNPGETARNLEVTEALRKVKDFLLELKAQL